MSYNKIKKMWFSLGIRYALRLGWSISLFAPPVFKLEFIFNVLMLEFTMNMLQTKTATVNVDIAGSTESQHSYSLIPGTKLGSPKAFTSPTRVDSLELCVCRSANRYEQVLRFKLLGLSCVNV